ncbi:MAG: thiamine diphosphokinase [Spirochaetia bacterium]
MQKTSRAVIVIGGSAPGIQKIRELCESAEYIIAADSGIDHLRSISVNVDLFIGDMDSVSSEELPSNLRIKEKEVHSTEKDYTDTELALYKCREKGFTDIAIIGGGGGRLDHLLALYSMFHRDSAPSQWHTQTGSAYLIANTFNISVKRGSIVSVFPIGTTTLKAQSNGLKWPLDELEFKIGDFGVSNQALDNKLGITIIQGKALVIVTPVH